MLIAHEVRNDFLDSQLLPLGAAAAAATTFAAAATTAADAKSQIL